MKYCTSILSNEKYAAYENSTVQNQKLEKASELMEINKWIINAKVLYHYLIGISSEARKTSYIL